MINNSNNNLEKYEFVILDSVQGPRPNYFCQKNIFYCFRSQIVNNLVHYIFNEKFQKNSKNKLQRECFAKCTLVA